MPAPKVHIKWSKHPLCTNRHEVLRTQGGNSIGFFDRLNMPLNHCLTMRLSHLQSCKKIMILDRKDRDLFIDLDLLHDLDQFIDLLKLILIFDL